MNVNSGRVVWKFSADGPIHSTPLVANEMIYFGVESGSFYGLDFRGAMKWRFAAKRAMTSSPVIKGQAIYTALLRWDIVWPWMRKAAGQFGSLDLKGTVSSPVIADDYIFVGAADGLYIV
ncbi:MAG: PQQ-binding-like beta-propeller repeat protein [Anaerolineales bacterium]